MLSVPVQTVCQKTTESFTPGSSAESKSFFRLTKAICSMVHAFRGSGSFHYRMALTPVNSSENDCFADDAVEEAV